MSTGCSARTVKKHSSTSAPKWTKRRIDVRSQLLRSAIRGLYGILRHERAARDLDCGRREFIGRNGTPSAPAALQREGMTQDSGDTIDPCAAIQVKLELAPGQSCELVVFSGRRREKMKRA